MSASPPVTLVSQPASAVTTSAPPLDSPSARARRRRGPAPGRYFAISVALHLATLAVLAGLSVGGAHRERAPIIESAFDSDVALAPDPEEPPPPPPDVPPRPVEDSTPSDDPPPGEFVPDDREFTDPRSVIAAADRFARNHRLPARPRPGAPSGSGEGRAAPSTASPAVEPPIATPPPPPPRPVDRTPARLVSSPAPTYPESARSSGVTGVVRLIVEILEDGTVGQVEVTESSGSRTLDDAAVRAVRAWRFEPERLDGVAQRVRVRIPDIRFRLER